MGEHEELLKRETGRRGWHIDVAEDHIAVEGVPYRQQDGTFGVCQVMVWVLEDGLTMTAPPDGSGATHAARLRGVSGGKAYHANGDPVGNVIWTDSSHECVISIKLDSGNYEDAWHALLNYCSIVAAAAQAGGGQETQRKDRVFQFEILGENTPDIREWQDKARGQKIGIVGLGGVGLWLLDIMSKTDVSEIRIWDGDHIEGRNLVRAPGWAGQDGIGQNKAEYFGHLYSQFRTGISVYPEYLDPGDPSNTLDSLDFVFIAIDRADTRGALCERLEQSGVSFVDVGMGIERQHGEVRGSLQVFFSGKDAGRWRIGIPTIVGIGEQEYHVLQLADLAALNASIAVGMWRRHVRQYARDSKDWLVRYSVESNTLLKRSE